MSEQLSTSPIFLHSAFGLVDARAPSFTSLHEFTIPSLAYNLGLIPRFNGLSMSVLTHSILCAILAGADSDNHSLIKSMLLHDAHEFYLGDLSAPILRAFPELDELDKIGQRAIFNHFEIPSTYVPLIKHYDQLALRVELEYLYGDKHIPSWFNPLPADPMMLTQGKKLIEFLLGSSTEFSAAVFTGIFQSGVTADLRSHIVS
jgi:hypothetical protein